MSATQSLSERSGAVIGARERSALMADFQRSRLLKAAVAIVSEDGYAATTATAVITRARVSRKTFYDHFADREACFLAVVEDFLAQVTAVVAAPYEAQGNWSERLREALVALLELLEREPDAGAFLLAYALGRGPVSVEPRASVLELLQRVVEEGRSQSRAREDLSPLTAELVVGGVLAVIHARLQQRPADLSGLANELMWMIVLPYLGRAAARRQLSRPAPIRAQTPPPPPANSLPRLNMRLTYRTARALEAIAGAPGSSNVHIGTEIGITDQGQISKLLARLAGLGLIRNTGQGQSRGAANAWHLTARGSKLEAALRLKSADVRVAP